MTPAGAAQLEIDEGIVHAADDPDRIIAYPDPLSPLAQACIKAKIKDWQRNWRKLPDGHLLSGHPWTCGFGHTGPDVGPDTVWTRHYARAVLVTDIAKHEAGLDRKLPWWRKLDPVRQDVVSNMAFNLGVEGLLGFKNTLAAIKAHRWTAAVAGMMQSKWADQVGDRAGRLAVLMIAGEYRNAGDTQDA